MALSTFTMFCSHLHYLVPELFIPPNSKPVYILLFVCLFVCFRWGWRDGERVGEKHQCVVASGMPPTGDLALQPRHVPWLGLEPVTFWFTGQHSIHWATLARAEITHSLCEIQIWVPCILFGNLIINENFCYYSFPTLRLLWVQSPERERTGVGIQEGMVDFHCLVLGNFQGF